MRMKKIICISLAFEMFVLITDSEMPCKVKLSLLKGFARAILADLMENSLLHYNMCLQLNIHHLL